MWPGGITDFLAFFLGWFWAIWGGPQWKAKGVRYVEEGLGNGHSQYWDLCLKYMCQTSFGKWKHFYFLCQE
jgi:hypothetical protein